MAKKSTIISNWPKYLLQWGVLAALIVFITGIIPCKEPADPEAYCPMGGLEALTTYFVNGSLPCSMSSLQIMMGIVLAAAVVLFSKLFCGYICPLGTVQDLLLKLRKSLKFKGLTNIVSVDASNNKLKSTAIYPQETPMSKLESFNVSNNPLESVPEVVINSPSIKTLNLSKTELSGDGLNFSGFSALEDLDL